MNDSPAGPLLQAMQEVLAEIAEPIAVLRVILNQAVIHSSADRGVLVEIGPSGEFDYRVLHHYQRRHLEDLSGEFSRTILAHVLDTGRPVVVENALNDTRFSHMKSIQQRRLVSVICLPIRVRDRTAALLYLENNIPGHFARAHENLLVSLVNLASPVLEALLASRRLIEERDALRLSENRLRDEVTESRRLLSLESSFARFVGCSAPVRKLEEDVRKAAATDFPVLLIGETGTGKSILARILHHAGPRAAEAFVTVFCPSFERGMVEAELFGHRKGAFTGAVTDRIGKVQAAEKGTLFLDEICELAVEIQPKLLRLLQERTYERVGDPTERQSDVRAIAATSRDLEEEVRAGRFRRDLYERLNFLPIRVPPLRERKEDLPHLLRHCLDLHEAGRWLRITDEALACLVEMDFAWPGNVRHVEQLAARLTAEQFQHPVGREDLERLLGPLSRGAEIMSSDRDPDGRGVSFEAGLPALLERAERGWLQEALRRYQHLKRVELAEKLRISESSLYKKMRYYGLGD